MADDQRQEVPAAGVAGLGDLGSELFRGYFDQLPKPAYIWQRSGEDFQIVAANRAAKVLPVSRAGPAIGAFASDFLDVHPTIVSDLDRPRTRDGTSV